MPDSDSPLLIKRYASRRLYNTESSDYVTLEDIAGFIRAGREVKIVDLKSGDDLTRQYLLQIIAEHESRGENVLPLSVLTDLVRSYTAQAQSVVPQFLAMSFEMLRQGPGKFAEQMSVMNPMMAQMSKMPGFEAMQRQQEAFLRSMMSGWPGMPGDNAQEGGGAAGGDKEGGGPASAPGGPSGGNRPEDLNQIRSQLAALQEQLSKLEK
ncbi:MAG: polyhydroxyalkanoate synthesis repressor PhaR [Pararhodobacter sp.]|nr:polyhydroxyalkanoate synthesis repressor PhaR [Pararhodobacter sp.]